MHDDAFGVGEALNETAFGKGLVIRGSHYVTVGRRQTDKSKFSYSFILINETSLVFELLMQFTVNKSTFQINQTG